MITFNYLDLLHLVMPEVIVVIAALCVLSVDLIFLRASETRAQNLRWRDAIACRLYDGHCLDTARHHSLRASLTECWC